MSTYILDAISTPTLTKSSALMAKYKLRLLVVLLSLGSLEWHGVLEQALEPHYHWEGSEMSHPLTIFLFEGPFFGLFICLLISYYSLNVL